LGKTFPRGTKKETRAKGTWKERAFNVWSFKSHRGGKGTFRNIVLGRLRQLDTRFGKKKNHEKQPRKKHQNWGGGDKYTPYLSLTEGKSL